MSKKPPVDELGSFRSRGHGSKFSRNPRGRRCAKVSKAPGAHAAVLGETSRLTARPSSSSATSNSQEACMFIQNLDVVPK